MKKSDVRVSERIKDKQGDRGDKGGRYREIGNGKRKGFRDKNFVETGDNAEVSERVISCRSGREDRGYRTAFDCGGTDVRESVTF
jgi:hypothetical protein